MAYLVRIGAFTENGRRVAARMVVDEHDSSRAYVKRCSPYFRWMD
jgi:hypothetical protein